MSSISSILGLSVPGILSPEKFQIVANKGVGTYRLIYQSVDSCPNGALGCKICNFAGGRTGRHPRAIDKQEIDIQMVRGAFGKPVVHLPNRWRLSPVILTASGVDYTEGEGQFHTEGRKIIWDDNTLVPDQGVFRVRYHAYREDWVSVQHVHSSFAGGSPQAEKARYMSWGEIDQGTLAATVQQDTAGYHMTVDDRFIPVDAEVDFETTIDVKLHDTYSRHLFVSEVLRAYGLDSTETKEIEVPGVTYDMTTGRFVLPKNFPNMPPKLVVQYRAAPIYYVFLNQGEFRQEHSSNHGKLVLLRREEIAK